MAEYINPKTGSRYFYTASYSPPSGSHKLLNFYSIKHLYYSSFDTGSGYVEESGSFENYIESSLSTGSRTLPANGEGLCFSIPQKLYGSNLEPGTVSISSSYGIVVDDEKGNLLNGSTKVGNVVYTHGQLIITDRTAYLHYSSSAEGTPSKLPCISFKSNVPIYTYNYSLKIPDYEYNHTLNPSAQSGSSILTYSGSRYLQPSGIYSSNVRNSDFQPYITSVGLYNDSNELIAIGKLGRPLPKPKDTELTINLTLDI